MQVRYYDLVGKRVTTADGHTVGRITDLLARAEGDALVVNAILVGSSGLLRRIGSKRAGNLRIAPVRRVPWTWVARIADTVQLGIPATALAKADQHDAEDEMPIGAAGRGMRR